jgi:hypothetical protein
MSGALGLANNTVPAVPPRQPALLRALGEAATSQLRV